MTISSSTRKAGPFTGNNTTATYPFAFKIFQASDLLVVRTSLTGVETTLTLTTDYTVSLNADQNSSPGGSVTLVAGNLATGLLLTMTSQVPYTQTTDLTNQGGFYPQVITNALDKLTIQTQQLEEQVDRAAKLPISSTEDTDALVDDLRRLADSADNIDTVAGNISNVNAVAGNAANINTVAGNNANVTTVAGISANVTSVAGNATNINAVAGNATNINTVAGNISNVNTVAGISSNVTSVAGNATNINAVAGNATNINTVAGSNTDVNTVATNISLVTTNATNISSINTNATNITAIQNAASNAASAAASAVTATTQAGIATTQANNASNSAALAAAAAASGMYSAVIDKSANYTIVAADAGDLIRVTTTSGNVTITLPAIGSTGISDGFKLAVVKWTSDINEVIIARSGSDTINGATSYTLGSQYNSVTLVADLETAQWFASASGLGATNINVDSFNGTGAQTAFTLSGDPGAENNTQVFVSGVYQEKDTYSVSGSTLTFSVAPPAGTSNIEVVWTQPLAIGVPSDNTVTPAKLDRAYVEQTSATGSGKLPAGTTGQRDGSPAVGYIRYNTTDGSFEGYGSSGWGAIGGGGGATKLLVTNRAASTVEVPLTNGFLAVTNRAGSTVNVSVS